MPEETPENQNRNWLWKYLGGFKDLHLPVEVSFKVFLGISVVIYVLGYFVVTVHLAHYGIHPLSLVRAQYIFAGIWAIAPIYVAYILFITIVGFIGGITSSGVDMKRAGGLALLGTLFLTIIGLMAKYTNNDHWTLGLGLVSIITGFLIICAFTLISIDLNEMREKYSPSRLVGISLIMVGIAVPLTYIFIFSNWFYPEIPSSLGGGKATQVWYEIKSESRNQIQSWVEGICGKDTVEKNLSWQQILEADDRYIAVPCPGKNYVLELSKDSVSAVIIATDGH